MTRFNLDVNCLAPEMPVLLAGPTASGKSALALSIAEAQGRTVVNADALQVYGCWSVLSARPTEDETARVPHRLYGHVAWNNAYSVGAWLRDLEPFLAMRPAPIIIGGTGLYFRALTEGLVDIPAVPPEVRSAADALDLATLISALDPETRAHIDLANRARVQRAYEVLAATGRGLRSWHAETPPPRLPLARAQPFVLMPGKHWLNPRIEARFDQMIAQGALDEVRALLDRWDPSLPSSRAIGAPELVGYLKGALTFEEARESAIVATRQYAKRQRSWFRSNMGNWQQLTSLSTSLPTDDSL